MTERPTVTYTVKHLAAGQPRPYADSTYEYEITLGGEWYGKSPDFGREVIKRVVGGLCRPFSKEKDDARAFYETYLDTLEKRGPGHWFVRIVEPYCD
jgi:hypothetical protein